jgi:Zn-dependent protease with chaperone function
LLKEYFSYPARYFNGTSPVPVAGEVLFTADRILFKNAQGEVSFPWSSIRDLERKEGGIQFYLGALNSQDSPLIECHIPKSDQKPILALYSESKSKLTGNLLAKFQSYFYSLSRWELAIFFSGVLFLAIFTYYLVGTFAFHLVPKSVDLAFGEKVRTMFEEEYEVCTDSEVAEELSSLVEILRPKDSDFQYEVKVLKNPMNNAFAIAGGKLYVFQGMLDFVDSPMELAGVMAHEISHVEKRHHIRNLIHALGTAYLVSMIVGPGFGDYEVLETLTEIGSTLFILKYSREFEEEADRSGVFLLHQAGYSAMGMANFFQRISASRDSDPTDEGESFGLGSGSDPRVSTTQEQAEIENTKKRNPKKQQGSSRPNSLGNGEEKEKLPARIWSYFKTKMSQFWDWSVETIIPLFQTHPTDDKRIKKILETAGRESSKIRSSSWEPKDWNRVKTGCSTKGESESENE